MVWFKVDDNLAFHQKTMLAGNAAMGLWVRAGSWCAQQLTDGFVPRDVARSLGTKNECDRLVSSRLWLERDDGYEFWQWGEEGRQPTRAEVEDKRKESRERQRRARDKAAASRALSQRDIQRDTPSDSPPDATVSHDSPDPTRPDPTLVPNGTTPLGGRLRATRLPDDWKPDEHLVAWQREQGIPDLVARRQLEKFRDYWGAIGGQRGTKLDWPATWRNWLRNSADWQAQSKPSNRPSTPWNGA